MHARSASLIHSIIASLIPSHEDSATPESRYIIASNCIYRAPENAANILFFFLSLCNCSPFWVLSILELARSESRIFPLVWLKSAAMRP